MRKLFATVAFGLIGLGVVALPLAHAEGSSVWDSDTAQKFLGKKHECRSPIEAVLNAMECFENEDPECVANAYTDDFELLHNGLKTGVDPSNVMYWKLAFFFSDFSVDINHLSRIGRKQVSIRYIETLDFVNGIEVNQHEHALVTLDRDCKIQLWDQYGDNGEQQAVADAIQAILCPNQDCESPQ